MTHAQRIDIKSLALDILSQARGKLLAGEGDSVQDLLEEAIFLTKQLSEEDPGRFYLNE